MASSSKSISRCWPKKRAELRWDGGHPQDRLEALFDVRRSGRPRRHADHRLADHAPPPWLACRRFRLRRTVVVPETFHLHPKLGNLVTSREQMAGGDKPIDWSAAEALAFASLVVGGSPVRLSGQDSGRGTFSHRHAVFRDVESEEPWIPVQHLATGQAPFQVWDSPLSEIAVLGFEVGYSLDMPEGLLLWDAQFGDFCNVAQVIIDQFLGSSCWTRGSTAILGFPPTMR